jgi:nucleotide-binding universal stress UspA family protein
MFKKILVAVDGSESSIQALDYAAHLADQNKATLHIISAVQPLPTLSSGGRTLQSYAGQYKDEIHQSYKKVQKTQTDRLSSKYPDLKIISKIEEGRPVSIIGNAARDADLLVIGHRGQGKILSWVLGSVAKQIVDSCTVPVLVVKDSEYCPT